MNTNGVFSIYGFKILWIISVTLDRGALSVFRFFKNMTKWKQRSRILDKDGPATSVDSRCASRKHVWESVYWKRWNFSFILSSPVGDPRVGSTMTRTSITLDGMPVRRRAPCTHTLVHTWRQLRVTWEVGRNERTRKNPQESEEDVQESTNSNLSSGGVVRQQCYANTRREGKFIVPNPPSGTFFANDREHGGNQTWTQGERIKL